VKPAVVFGKRTYALADPAVDNFIEMRDKPRRKHFGRKKSSIMSSASSPASILPLYTMVTFTRIPYAEAARRARRQDRIVYGMLVSIALLVALGLMREHLLVRDINDNVVN
jgi:kynurenine 3-monooxygenase